MGFNYHGITTDNTKQIVHFVKELKYEDIPPVVIERAKMMVLHTVGVCLCSSELQEIKDAIEIAKEMSPAAKRSPPSGRTAKRSAGKRPRLSPARWATCSTGKTAP